MALPDVTRHQSTHGQQLQCTKASIQASKVHTQPRAQTTMHTVRCTSIPPHPDRLMWYNRQGQLHAMHTLLPARPPPNTTGTLRWRPPTARACCEGWGNVATALEPSYPRHSCEWKRALRTFTLAAQPGPRHRHLVVQLKSTHPLLAMRARLHSAPEAFGFLVELHIHCLCSGRSGHFLQTPRVNITCTN